MTKLDTSDLLKIINEQEKRIAELSCECKKRKEMDEAFVLMQQRLHDLEILESAKLRLWGEETIKDFEEFITQENKKAKKMLEEI